MYCSNLRKRPSLQRRGVRASGEANMATRTKITELWMCVTDDGTGSGETVMCKSRLIGIEDARRMGAPDSAHDRMIVPFMTYDPNRVQAMVNSARTLGKPFRVLRYQT